MRAFLLAVLLLLDAGLAAQAPQRKAEANDPFLSGKPLTLEELLEAAGVIYEGRLSRAIEARGLAFSAAPEALERLRQAGLSEDLLKLISRIAAPPPPPPPPPPKEVPRAGPLTVHCAPQECEVLVNGRSHGLTRGGSTTITGLEPGKVFLDFKKEGYEGRQAALVLEAGAAAEHRAVLMPTLSTQEKLGAELFSRVLEAMGGDAGLDSLRSLSAAGSAILWDRAGGSTEWTVTLRLQLPGRAFWELRAKDANWWIGRVGEQIKSGGSRKLKGSAVAMELEKHLAELLAYQVAAVVDRIRGGNLRLQAMTAAPSGPEGVTLRAEGPSETYRLTIGPDFTPTRIVHESSAGIGSAFEAHYADYDAAGGARYPMTTTLRFTDGSKRGMEIRLNKLQRRAVLKDSDFRK
jgi:hypothetical protein